MENKKFDDFVRFIRKFCKEQGIELQEYKKSGPHIAFVLYSKEGGQKFKIDRFVMRADRKEVGRHGLRRFYEQRTARLEKMKDLMPTSKETCCLKELVSQVERWIEN